MNNLETIDGHVYRVERDPDTGEIISMIGADPIPPMAEHAIDRKIRTICQLPVPFTADQRDRLIKLIALKLVLADDE